VAALKKQALAHAATTETAHAERRRCESRAVRAEVDREEAVAEVQRVREACERRMAEAEEEAKQREKRAGAVPSARADALQRQLDEASVAHAEELARLREASAAAQQRSDERMSELERGQAAARSEAEAMRLSLARAEADASEAVAAREQAQQARRRSQEAAAAEASTMQVCARHSSHPQRRQCPPAPTLREKLALGSSGGPLPPLNVLPLPCAAGVLRARARGMGGTDGTNAV
jgi:hypothetical protein